MANAPEVDKALARRRIENKANHLKGVIPGTKIRIKTVECKK